jgi:predicted secreted protein with PEFG-CTERM motif
VHAGDLLGGLAGRHDRGRPVAVNWLAALMILAIAILAIVYARRKQPA